MPSIAERMALFNQGVDESASVTSSPSVTLHGLQTLVPPAAVPDTLTTQPEKSEMTREEQMLMGFYQEFDRSCADLTVCRATISNVQTTVASLPGVDWRDLLRDALNHARSKNSSLGAATPHRAEGIFEDAIEATFLSYQGGAAGGRTGGGGLEANRAAAPRKWSKHYDAAEGVS